MMYRMFFLHRNFVFSLLRTQKPLKTLKTLKPQKNFFQKPRFSSPGFVAINAGALNTVLHCVVPCKY